MLKITNVDGAIALVPATTNSVEDLERLGYTVEVLGRDDSTHRVSLPGVAAQPPIESWEDYLPPVTAQPRKRG